MASPTSPKNKPAVYKLLLLGDSAVGKSALLQRYADGTFSHAFITTIGIDFKIKTIELPDGNQIRLQIWDTSGQERFRTITNSYYRGVHGIVLLYDISCEESFSSLSYWMRSIEQLASPEVEKVLVGTKGDLEGLREVQTARAQSLADDCEMPFFETSAFHNTNVSKVFDQIARNIHLRVTGGYPAIKDNRNIVDIEDGKGDPNKTTQACSCW